MMQLNTDDLLALRDRLRKELESLDRAARFAVLREAMGQDLNQLMGETIPAMMVPTEIQFRGSVLALEALMQDDGGGVSRARAQSDSALASARNRTVRLERWLESLS